MSDKDIRLLYSLIKRLLFISKITRPDVHAYVSYIITRMELPTIYHKDKHLNVDVLFMKKIVGNSVLVIMYDTQACTSGLVISLMNKSLLMRLYNNRIPLSNMLGDSVFS